MRAHHVHRHTGALLAVATIFVACTGGSSTGGDDVIGDAGASSEGGGSGGADANACVTIDPSSYDRSCSVDADCMLIVAGTLCPGGCDCASSPINKSGATRYQAAISGVKLLACPCVAPGIQRCVNKTCTLCSFGPGASPGCPDAG